MERVVLNVDLTVDIHTSKKTIKLHSVKNTIGNNITRTFHEFIKEKCLPLDTQEDLERAIEVFVREFANNSTVLP